MTDIDWRDVAAIFGVLALVSSFLVWALRARLSDDFVRKSDLTAMSERLGQVERALRDVPSHGELRAVADRLVEMVTKVGVLEARLIGVDGGVKRVEHDLRLLITSMINKEDKADVAARDH